MATTVTVDQDILDGLVKLIIKLDELSFNDKLSTAQQDDAQKKADDLRTVHLHLFAAEFNAATAGFQSATDNLRQVMGTVQETIADLARIAATLKTIAKVIDLGTQLAAKAAKIALV